MSLGLLFLVIALVLFVLAAVGASSGRFNLGWAGMACVAAAMIAGSATLIG